MNKTSPIVSVCLPVYNGSKYLASAIESVLSQDFDDLELIIVDDASLDDSYLLIQEYAEKDSRIRFFQNSENAGLLSSYNKCLNYARGRYFKLFSQDDLLLRDSLSKAVSILEKNDSLAIVAHGRSWIDKDGEDISEFVDTPSASENFPSNDSVDGCEVIRSCIQKVANLIGEPASILARRQYFGFQINSDYHYFGDLAFWLEALRNHSSYFIDEPLSQIRIHDQSAGAVSIKELLFAPDVVRLLQTFEDVVCHEETSYEEQMQKCARAIAQKVRYLSATFQIGSENFKTITCQEREGGIGFRANSSEQLVNDLLAFRELYFYSLIKPGLVSNKVSMNDKQLNATRVKQLEYKLVRLLNSPSWRYTRVFRELNSLLSGREKSEDFYDLPTFYDNKSYAEYLRNQIKLIKQSRSWRITNRLRTMKIL